MKDYSTQLTAFLRTGTLFANDDLKEALDRQERLGGSVADYLFILEAANEKKLLRAISECFGWRTVSASDLKPSSDTLALISGWQAWKMRVLPFEEDSASNTVRIACRNPEDSDLREKLETLLPGREIVSYAAIGPALDCAIIDCYRHTTLNDKPGDSANKETGAEGAIGEEAQDKTALIVAPKQDSENLLARALVSEGYQVVICQSPAEALEEFESYRPRLILIRDILKLRYRRLLEQSARLTPDCVIRFYSDLTDLVSLGHDKADRELLLTVNLHLATATMAAIAGKPTKEAVKTGQYVDRLCRRLQVDSYDRLILVSTAYLLDISKLYFRDDPPSDRETALYRMLTTTGDNLIHSPAVLKALRRMYPDLKHMKAEEVRSAETVHGNILTVVDFYLRHFGSCERLTPHRYETIQHNLRAQVGEILIPEVTDIFMELIHEEIDYSRYDRSLKQVLVFDELGIATSALTDPLQSAGFECTVAVSKNQFLLLFNQHHPDFIVIAARGRSERIQQLACSLASSGVAYPDIPAFVFHESNDTAHVAPLLDMGIRDVIRFTGACDILRIRMEQILAARERESLERLKVFQDMGTHGSLEHMNVIDLLQAVRPGEKSAHISVTARGQQLTMYLDHGQLLYAECEGKTGAEAIFDALAWDTGIWSVDHIERSELPEPNNERSIDSILIEGCTFIDEISREKVSAEEGAAAPIM